MMLQLRCISGGPVFNWKSPSVLPHYTDNGKGVVFGGGRRQ